MIVIVVAVFPEMRGRRRLISINVFCGSAEST